MKKALITGITGQDGSYLAEFLLSHGYVVHGIVRRSSTFGTERIDHIHNTDESNINLLFLHYGDMVDSLSLSNIINKVEPDEIYNLAAQSHVKISFDQPDYTFDVVAMGTLRLLESTRQYELSSGKKVRIYQAGSSEMYGSTPPPQNELSPFKPLSPYASAKVAAHNLCVNYRDSYGMFICNGILFNHESPRRPKNFVTSKIVSGLIDIRMGIRSKLSLGNLESYRDWGFAGDYVKAMWLMLQQDKPDDYVIATGVMHSVKDFLRVVCEELELGYWSDFIIIDPKYFRPNEVDALQGDSTKARSKLGWESEYTMRSLVKMMIEEEFNKRGIM